MGRQEQGGANRDRPGADTLGGNAARVVVTEEDADIGTGTGAPRAAGPDPAPGEPGQPPEPDPGDQESEDYPTGIGADSPMNEGSEDTAAPPVDPAESRLGGLTDVPDAEP